MLVLGDVPQARDAATRPFGTVVLPPRRANLDDRHRRRRDIRFDPDLMERMWWRALLAEVVNRSNVQAGER